MSRKIGRSKAQFKDFLAQVEGIDPEGDEFFKLFEEAKESDDLARGFRAQAYSTQLIQDNHLALYRSWVQRLMSTEHLVDDAAIDRLCFPEPDINQPNPWSKLLQQLRYFLKFAVLKCVPRSTEDDHISYQALTQYRRSLLFWVKRKYAERHSEGPEYRVVYNSLTEMMQFLNKHHGMSSGRLSKPNRTRVGTWELLQMMEIDMNETVCIELAECHHLAWVLGRLGALRPGSLAMPHKVDPDRQLPFLAWKDLTIERTGVGRFSVKMVIRNLKTNFLDPEKQGDRPGNLVLTLDSPKGQLTFELSAPHRILTIALRRRALDGIETIDELFNGRQKFINIKPEFLGKPVLVVGTEGGRSINLDQPMRSGALSEYLKRRGEKAGYLEPITFYSIRRNTAQELSNAVGTEMTRAIMAHDPSSRILEKYYIHERTALLNLTALALGEDGNEDGNERQITDILAATRLGADQMRKMGPMLNNLVADLRETDDEYPHNGTPAQKKNRDRVLRRSAFRTLMKDLIGEQQRRLTMDETNRRVSSLESRSNDFNRRVVEQARKFLTDGAQSDGNEAADDQALHDAGVNLDQDFDEDPEVPEPDAEQQFSEQIINGDEVQTFPDELTDDLTGCLSTLDYSTAARSAMEIWLNVGKEGSKFGRTAVGMILCPLCQEDETIDVKMRSKEYYPSKLTRHMKGEVHSDFGKFQRRAQKDAVDHHLNGVRCELCMTIAPDGMVIPTYSTVGELLRHVERSNISTMQAVERDLGWWKDFPQATQQKLTVAHDQRKRDLGWYEPNFKGDLAHKAKEKSADQSRKRRRLAETNPAFAFSDIRELQNPVQLPERPHIMQGSKPTIPFDGQLPSTITLSKPPEEHQRPPNRRGTTIIEIPSSEVEPKIPLRLERHIRRSKIPGAP